LDEAERRAGLSGGTVRTMEGPLYIAGAPLSKGEARLDDGTDAGEVLFVDGQVRDVMGKPIAGAIVDVWHANTMGQLLTFRSDAGGLQPPSADRGGQGWPLPVPLGYADHRLQQLLSLAAGWTGVIAYGN